MIRLQTLTSRQFLIVVHDLAITALALVATLFVRFEDNRLAFYLSTLHIVVPALVVYAGFVYYFFGLYKAKWRFASLPDLKNIFWSCTVLAVSLLVVDYILVSPNVTGQFYFGKLTIALYWVMQMVALGGPRIAYRYFRDARTRHHARTDSSLPTLIVGRAADAEVLLRGIESGAVGRLWPAGVLSPSPADRGQSIRGVPVLGAPNGFEHIVAALAGEGTHVARVVMTPSALAPEARPEAILMQARRLGIATSRMPALDEGGEALRLAPVAVEDLLLRPSVSIDYRRLEDFVRGKSVVVTGGGGSIGSEICRRIATFGASRLMVIENAEPALHAIQESLAAMETPATISGRLADVRDRERIHRLLADFKPDIVFHAAALKHVPLLERDWDEAVKTNVFGSANVADAASASGASAMVMISTDKAIEPVSMLGATKRFAEMYCQALDADLARRGGMRLISVRFGNVLASNGSVVPKFKAQIEAGGPVTVTHPEMVRYFMTIREACDLVITAATHACAAAKSDVSVYVLNMGQPVKILDLAERMIRLSGLEPGRDIEIAFVGMRPGERLNEILFAQEESGAEIGIPGIVAAQPSHPSLESVRGWLVMLEQALASNERSAIDRALRDAVPDFRGEAA